MAGRDRISNEGAAGADAECLHPDRNEHLWTGYGIVQTGSEWGGRGDGVQTGESEHLNLDFLLGVYSKSPICFWSLDFRLKFRSPDDPIPRQNSTRLKYRVLLACLTD